MLPGPSDVTSSRRAYSKHCEWGAIGPKGWRTSLQCAGSMRKGRGMCIRHRVPVEGRRQDTMTDWITPQRAEGRLANPRRQPHRVSGRSGVLLSARVMGYRQVQGVCRKWAEPHILRRTVSAFDSEDPAGCAARNIWRDGFHESQKDPDKSIGLHGAAQPECVEAPR